MSNSKSKVTKKYKGERLIRTSVYTYNHFKVWGICMDGNLVFEVVGSASVANLAVRHLAVRQG